MPTTNIDLIKKNRKEEKAILEKLKSMLTDITDLCSLDDERMAKRIQVALKSEYGRINGMINLLASVSKWPAEQGDGASVALNQALIEKDLGIDLMLLEDISAFKGYHTFHSDDDLVLIAGVQPDFENYKDYSTIFLEEIGFERTAATIERTTWEKKEIRAIAKTNESITDLTEAAEKHKALMQQ